MAMRKELVAALTIAAATGCAIAFVRYKKCSKQWKRAISILRDFKEESDTPVSKMWEVADAMVDQMKAGLASDLHSSNLRMLVSPINCFPSGNEKGLFYGLELGRTKVQVLRVQLGGKELGVAKKEFMEVPVPINLMVGTSLELYNYLAEKLVKFISASSYCIPGAKPNEIGFTFSFPIIYDSTSGKTIVEWNKGFSIKESMGKDSLASMNEAMVKHGVGMHISSVVNDTVGTLLGGKYCSSNTVAAVILGDGTNAAYFESLDSIPKWRGPHNQDRYMAINMEWGDFVSPQLPITDFDTQLDMESPRPGEQVFEKLIAGMYLGDIVRRVLLKLAIETKLWGETVPLKLRIPFALRTPDLAAMHQDTSPGLSVVADKLDKALGIRNTTLSMRRFVKDICETVTKRAARLAAAGIVGILKKLGRDGTDKKAEVVVEGELYEHYRLFRTYLHSGVKEMLHGKLSDNVSLEHWPDGCGIGSALLTIPTSEI